MNTCLAGVCVCGTDAVDCEVTPATPVCLDNWQAIPAVEVAATCQVKKELIISFYIKEFEHLKTNIFHVMVTVFDGLNLHRHLKRVYNWRV